GARAIIADESVPAGPSLHRPVERATHGSGHRELARRNEVEGKGASSVGEPLGDGANEVTLVSRLEIDEEPFGDDEEWLAVGRADRVERGRHHVARLDVKIRPSEGSASRFASFEKRAFDGDDVRPIDLDVVDGGIGA